MKAKTIFQPGIDPFLYTELELDYGMGMEFHPLSGMVLRYHTYHPATRCFSIEIAEGAWSSTYDSETVFHDPISGGKTWSVGDPYPDHWLYDPDTGEPLHPIGGDAWIRYNLARTVC